MSRRYTCSVFDQNLEITHRKAVVTVVRDRGVAWFGKVIMASHHARLVIEKKSRAGSVSNHILHLTGPKTWRACHRMTGGSYIGWTKDGVIRYDKPKRLASNRYQSFSSLSVEKNKADALLNEFTQSLPKQRFAILGKNSYFLRPYVRVAIVDILIHLIGTFFFSLVSIKLMGKFEERNNIKFSDCIKPFLFLISCSFYSLFVFASSSVSNILVKYPKPSFMLWHSSFPAAFTSMIMVGLLLWAAMKELISSENQLTFLCYSISIFCSGIYLFTTRNLYKGSHNCSMWVVDQLAKLGINQAGLTRPSVTTAQTVIDGLEDNKQHGRLYQP